MLKISGSKIMAKMHACLRDDETLQGWSILVNGDDLTLVVTKQKLGDPDVYLRKVKLEGER